MTDEFRQTLLEETVPVVMQALGIPRELAELALRHVDSCPKEPCEVNTFLYARINEITAEMSGIPVESIDSALRGAHKGFLDTLRLQREAGVPTGSQELLAAYRASQDALDAYVGLVQKEGR